MNDQQIMLQFCQDFNRIFGGPFATATWLGKTCVIVIAGKRAEITLGPKLLEIEPENPLARTTTC